MILTLEILAVTDLDAPSLSEGQRVVFESSGGTIGRLADNSWVLPSQSVSGHHARITWRDGVFLVEDLSKYGVFVNGAETRLDPGHPHTLTSGDTFTVGPYKVVASITPSMGPDDDPFAVLAGQTNPPMSPAAPFPVLGLADLIPASGARQGEEVDPLKALGLAPTPPVGTGGPRAEDLQRRAPMDHHYSPPAPSRPVEPPPPLPPAALIPDDYDPLLSDPSLAFPVSRIPDPSVPAPERPIDLKPGPPVEDTPHAAPASPSELPILPAASAQPLPPLEVAHEPAPAPAETSHVRLGERADDSANAAPPPAPSSGDASDHPALAALLAGAGLDDVTVTPELARSLGKMLRVVVGGVMDVLRVREEVNHEFRLPQNRLMAAHNNPLKLSVDAADALHNLFVKQSPAFLGPVEAFEDVFDDLREHQLAELEGMQTAFQAIFADLHPDRLEDQFDHQIKTASILPTLNTVLYWELYRDRAQQIAADPDKSFHAMFVERFRQAYEGRLGQLRAQRHKAEGQS